MIAANLPYNVATLLLIGWLETEPWPPWYGRMVLMFQSEVAERIVAAPGTKAYGRLAVIAQWRTQRAAAVHAEARGLHAAARRSPRRSSSSCRRAAAARMLGRDAGARSPPPPSASAARCCARASSRSLADPEPLLAAAGIAPTLRGEALTVPTSPASPMCWSGCRGGYTGLGSVQYG